MRGPDEGPLFTPAFWIVSAVLITLAVLLAHLNGCLFK